MFHLSRDMLIQLEFPEHYKTLSSIQSVCIFVTAISVFDLGFSGHFSRGIGFNHLLFHLEFYPDYVLKNPFWGEFQFWGYCFTIVAICQVLKIYQVQDGVLYQFARICGLIAILAFVGLHLVALALVIDRFDFQSHAFSSLVDYGPVPKILTVYSMVIPGLTAPVYLLYISFQLSKRLIQVLTICLSLFSSSMFLSIGLTSTTNEPVDHGVFVLPMLSSLALLILILSVFPLESEIQRRKIRSFGIFSLLIYLILLVFSPNRIILGQILIGGLFSFWFYLFGWEYHQQRLHTGQSPVKVTRLQK